ncbi:MAG: A/G-specific adenine glycosylase [Candidatus Sungbacteria bacterium]|nr:A/G-specific adenine glycosylase [Candidatus Sungbacteria bacterium]
MADRKLTKQQVQKFRAFIWRYYRKNRRDLPWRETRDPYKVLVSEIMLQQTQVERARRYYPKFLKTFPDWQPLAKASLKKILAVWQGMGYNRRVIFLRELARKVIKEYRGALPPDVSDLVKLPGVGKATAGAISAYAFNLPAIFIETNIRRVFIHKFFSKKNFVHDREIFPLVGQTLDKRNPREWYWALTDYGAMLGKKHGNPNRKSVHYAKQSAFEGSRRQLRGEVLKLLLKSALTRKQLFAYFPKQKFFLDPVLSRLHIEGFIKKQGGAYSIR